MAIDSKCRNCGAKTSAEGLEGLCQDCLAKAALHWEGEPPREPATQRISEEGSRGRSPSQHFGDYELIEEIAHGGMGVVYKARQVSLNRTVAVKMIRAGQFASKEFVHRFRVEASAAAVLQHPNIVAVHEVGVHDGQHFFSMDYVAGKNLSEMVRDGPLPLTVAARYVQKIAEAIHYAHQSGILHRDLKPSNVIIDGNDQPRITDFGLAKQLNSESSATLTGEIMGTPGYMPPEQASGNRGAVKVWSDVYSIGAILYHLLTGRAPFVAGSLEETLNQVLHQDPISVRLLNPAVPRDLNTICLKCLEKEPAKRYATAQLVAEELTRFLNKEPILARPISTIGKAARWCRRKPALAAALALLVVLAVGSPVAAFRINQGRKLAENNRQLAEDRLYVADMNLGYQALLEGNFARARELLEAHRHQKPDRRGFEWRYLWSRTRGEFAHQFIGHSNSLDKVAWSPDDRLLASRSFNGTVKIWSAEGGKELATLTNISAFAGFSRDGTRLFLGRNSNSVVAYDWEKREVHSLLHNAGDLLAIVADGQTAATRGTNFALRLWNLSTGEMTLELPDTDGLIAQAVSIDGKRAALVSRLRWVVTAQRKPGTTISIWDLATQKELFTVSEPRDVHAMQFSPDNSFLAVGGPGGIVRLWEGASNREPRVIHAHEVNVPGLAFSRDGRILATGSSDQTIKIWAVAGGELLATFRGHEHSISALDFNADGKRLGSGSFDQTVKIWDLGRPAAAQMISGFTLDQAGRVSPVFSENGKLVAGRCQKDDSVPTNHIRIWDTTTLREIATLPGAGMPLPGGFSRDGKSLLTFRARSGTLRLYDISSQTIVKETPLENSPQRFFSVALSTEAGLLAVSDENCSISLWDILSGRKEANFIGATAAVSLVNFSPNGNVLAAVEVVRGSSNSVNYTPHLHLWDARSLAPLAPLVVPEPAVIHSFAFSPDSRCIGTATSQARTVQLWELSTRQLVTTFTGHRQQIPTLAFSPEGRVLATASSDGTIKLWDLSVRQEMATLKFNESGLRSVDARPEKIAFSPDGSVLMAVAADGTTIRFFRAPSWKEIAAAETSAR